MLRSYIHVIAITYASVDDNLQLNVVGNDQKYNSTLNDIATVNFHYYTI